MRWIHGLTCMAAFLGLSAVASADMIFLLPWPDLEASFLDVNYSPDTSDFTAEGDTGPVFTLEDGPHFVSGHFSLSATIDSSGVASGASLQITGCIDGIDDPGCDPLSRLLLSSDELIRFQYEPQPGGEINFGFLLNGGDLWPTYYDPNAYVKMMLYAFPGDFTQEFSSGFDAVADTGVIPEPGTWVLVGLGIGSLWLARRRTKSA